jgi:uncharacterized phage-associated protein
MSVRFEFDPGRTIAAVTYLVGEKLPEITKWKICKLLYLADRLHLVRYGRPITGDVYYAVPFGPVPSYTLDALDDENELAIDLSTYVRQITNSFPYPQYVLNPERRLNFKDELSESDIKVLAEVIRRFGGMKFGELSTAVHETAAYRKAWHRRRGDRELMLFEEFFEDEPTARGEFLEELTENNTTIEKS